MMSTDAAAPEPDGLQFDHAEFVQPQAPEALSCAGCKRPIADSYYAAGQLILCEPCRERIEASLSQGARASGLARALLFGTGAAIAGAVAYEAVRQLLHAEASIVSVLVGYMVGTMVRRGSGGLGGLAYQVMAAGLTYLSIALAGLFHFLIPGPGDGPWDRAMLVLDHIPEAVHDCLLGPILRIQQQPLMMVLLGFGLWQAWRLTRRARLDVTGPYRVADFEPGGELTHA